MFILYAFALGILVALNPCQLAINLSALSYLSHTCNGEKDTLRKGLIYIIGRTLTYSIMGIILMILFVEGLSIDGIQEWLSKGEDILPYILIAVAIYLLFRTFHHHDHHGDNCHNCGTTIKRNGPFGALALGLTLAFAFCPESAIMYFGMMIPLAATSTPGWCVPLVFAISAALPVIILVWLFSKAKGNAERFQHRFSHFQQWLNGLMAAAMITIAIVLLIQH